MLCVCDCQSGSSRAKGGLLQSQSKIYYLPTPAYRQAGKTPLLAVGMNAVEDNKPSPATAGLGEPLPCCLIPRSLPRGGVHLCTIACYRRYCAHCSNRSKRKGRPCVAWSSQSRSYVRGAWSVPDRSESLRIGRGDPFFWGIETETGARTSSMA